MAITDEIPRSRLTLTYRTRVHGEPEDVTLPLRLLILGDFSGGTSKDRKVDLDMRQLRNIGPTKEGSNLGTVMGDMNMSVSFEVDNMINPEAGEDKLKITLPVTSMASFTPEQIAQHVPQVKSLLILRKLLLEVQGNLDNRKDFRKALRALSQDKDAIAALKTQVDGLGEDFKNFKVPVGRKAVAGDKGGDAGGDAPAKKAAPKKK